MQKLKLDAGDTVEMKKPHPCGSRLFKILRAGSDVRLECTGCGHEIVLERLKMERSVKKLIKNPAESK